MNSAVARGFGWANGNPCRRAEAWPVYLSSTLGDWLAGPEVVDQGRPRQP
jgi:hypothetical protein